MGVITDYWYRYRNHIVVVYVNWPQWAQVQKSSLWWTSAELTRETILTAIFGVQTVFYWEIIFINHTQENVQAIKPGIEQVQALAYISRSALCCHSNETRAAIANPRNSAQL